MDNLIIDNFSEINIDLIFNKDDVSNSENKKNAAANFTQIKGDSNDRSNNTMDRTTVKRVDNGNDVGNNRANEKNMAAKNGEQQTSEEFKEIGF